MAGILPQRHSLKSALVAVTIIFSSLITLVFGYLFLTGQNLMTFFIGVNNTVLAMIQNISVAGVRIYKIASVVLSALGDLLSFILNVLLKFTALISPEIQIALIVVTLMATVALFVAFKKKLLIGERT
jgi:hypothetical protein